MFPFLRRFAPMPPATAPRTPAALHEETAARPEVAVLTAEESARLERGFAAAVRRTRAYHATRSANVDGSGGILDAGLDPAFGGTGESARSEVYRRDAVGRVHVTRSEQRAEYYRRGFGDQQVRDPASGRLVDTAAETLVLSLPRDLVVRAQEDPHDAHGLTLDARVPARFIRRPAEERFAERCDPAAAPVCLRARARVAASHAAEAEAIRSHFDPATAALLARTADPGAAFQRLRGRHAWPPPGVL